MFARAALALCLFAAALAAQHAAPNVVFVMADDLGYSELGCYGQTKIRTPHIDRIAAEGIRFTDHYSGSAVCAPSRCVLMTGMHTGHAIVRDNWEAGGWGPDETEGQYPLPVGTYTLGKLFQGRAYVTAAIGKWGLGGPGTTGEPNRQGFDRWFGYLCQRVAHNHYPTHLWRDGERVELEGNVWGNHVGAVYSHDLMADEALAFVRERAARDERFFLYVPFHIPHLAIQAPEDALDEYRGQWDDPPYEGGKGYLPHPTPRAGYAAMVTRMDRDVGRLLDLLDELGLDDDTLVVFTSDNGATFDIGGADSVFFESGADFRGRKGSLYEGGLRVPFVARWPGVIEAGQVSGHVSAQWDVLPTLAELIGVDVPVDVDGVSFAPTLTGRGEQRDHAFLYWEFPGYGGQQAVRLGRWKGIRRGMRKGNDAIALYDLDADVGEQHDVAAEHPEIVARIAELMRSEHAPSDVFPMPILDR